ncbi:MAG: hypothetical protein IPK26_25405 [Planctomycetes bacterium]|nr:hypothetical protein [Planctomycetota bacterium]
MNVRALATLLGAAVTPAQHAGPEPRDWPMLQQQDVRNLRDQGRDLIEPAFLVRDDGELWVNPDPAAGAAIPGRYVEFGLPDLLRLEAPEGRSPMTWNRALWFVHGPGELLDATDGERHLRRGDLPTGLVEIRQFLAQPLPEQATPARQHRLAVDLAVMCRRLVELRATNALPELRLLSKRQIDPLTTAAAERAIATLTGKEPAVDRVPRSLARLPAGAALVAWFDQSRLPPLHSARAAMRAAAFDEITTMILAAGGTVSPPQAAGAMLMCDLPGELPFEIVRRCGPVRVDHGWLAVAENGRAAVLELAGQFPEPLLAASKHPTGSAQHLQARHGRWPETEGGIGTATLVAAGEHAFVIAVGASPGFMAQTWLPDLEDTVVTIDFLPQLSIAVRAAVVDPGKRATTWREWRDRCQRQTTSPANAWFAELNIAVENGVATMTWKGELTAAAALDLLQQVHGR